MNILTKATIQVVVIIFMFAFEGEAKISITDSIIGRPFKDFSTTAFCSYSSFHPSQYIVDNNWDILCTFRKAGPVSTLDSLTAGNAMDGYWLIKKLTPTELWVQWSTHAPVLIPNQPTTFYKYKARPTSK